MTKEFEVDTRCLVRAVLKKSWILALAALVCAGAVLLGGIALTGERYMSQVTFCVNTGGENVNNQTLTAARDLTDSCGVRITLLLDYSRPCLWVPGTVKRNRLYCQ